LVGGSVTSGDGWFDPYTYLTTSYATLKKAGVNMKGGVKGVETDGETGRVKKVHTEEGEGVECEFFVNASGAGGGDVVDMVTGGGELEYPVKPRKRTVFHFHANKITTGDGGNVVPLTVDTTGVWFRGVGEVGGGGGEFLAGCTPPIDPDRDYRVDGLEPESGLWNDGVWEKLYERVEEFGDVKVKVRRDRGGERDDGLIMGGCCSWRTGNITHNLRGGPTTAVNSRALIPHPFRDCASLAVSLIPLPVAE